MSDELPGRQALQIVVISGAGYDAAKRANNKVLATETGADQIAEIRSLLKPAQRGERFDWMEWPTLSLVLLADRAVVAEYGLLSRAEWVRDGDAGDYAVEDPAAVRAWLAVRSIDLP